jgi:hypothetical protein
LIPGDAGEIRPVFSGTVPDGLCGGDACSCQQADGNHSERFHGILLWDPDVEGTVN